LLACLSSPPELDALVSCLSKEATSLTRSKVIVVLSAARSRDLSSSLSFSNLEEDPFFPQYRRTYPLLIPRCRRSLSGSEVSNALFPAFCGFASRLFAPPGCASHGVTGCPWFGFPFRKLYCGVLAIPSPLTRDIMRPPFMIYFRPFLTNKTPPKTRFLFLVAGRT